MGFNRLEVKMDKERQVMTALILNTDVCSQLLPDLKPEYFTTSWIATIFKWIRSYFDLYHAAPEGNLREYYENEVALNAKISDTDAEAIGETLRTLSEVSPETINNPDFYIKSGRQWAKVRSLELLRDDLNQYVGAGQFDIAEKRLFEFREQAVEVVKPFSLADMVDILAEVAEQNDDPLVRFNGPLGDLIGPLQRTWLTFFMAPPKVGKSNFLVHTVLAALCNPRNKVVVFSHEMGRREWTTRFVRQICPGPELDGTYETPVFDCKKNALNTCTLPQRSGIGPITTANYSPCSACRFHSELYKNFEPVYHKIPMQYEGVDTERLMKTVARFDKYWGNRLKVICYPLGSANVDDMRKELDRLVLAEHFVADVVIDDYIGAHRKSNPKMENRDHYEYEARGLKNIAAAYDTLCVSAFQGNRASIGARVLEQQNAAEDIRIINHADKVITLNQQPKEKDMGVIRIGKCADRHMDWSLSNQCTVLNFMEGMFVVKDSVHGTPVSATEAFTRAMEKKDAKSKEV